MNEKEEAHIEIDGVSLHVQGGGGDEEVRIGPGGIHVRDGDEEVRVGWTGIRVREGRTRARISFWKPMVGCGVALLVFAALIAFVVMGIVRLMTR